MVNKMTDGVLVTVGIEDVTSTQVTVLAVFQDTRDQRVIKVKYWYTLYKD